MSTVRIDTLLKQPISSEAVTDIVENDEYGFKVSPVLLDGLLSLKESRTFALAVTYNGLKAESYLRGWPFLTTLALKDPKVLESGKLEVLFEGCENVNLIVHYSRKEGRHGTALHCLLAGGQIEVATKFMLLAIKKNLRIDAGIRDVEGLTIVHLAARLRATAFLNSLKETADAVNAADLHGRTPLHYAYALADRDLIMVLQSQGAGDSLTDKNGHKPKDMLTVSLPLLKTWLKSEFGLEPTDELIAKIKADRLALIFNPIQAQPIVYSEFSYKKI